jgi:glycosyltransferase involved in cell wall biosynthesis
MPVVSVVMPVFNSEQYIRESVDSVLSQTLKDIELIIVDDGSTDKSEEIIQSIHDNRIVYRKLDKNMGAATATNIGHALANGKYIAHMDSDDIAVPNRLELQALFLEKFPGVDVLGGKMEVFGAKHYVAYAPSSDGEIKANLLFGAANIYNPTAMFRRSFMKEKQITCDQSHKTFDWKFWVQAMMKGARFANLDGIVLRYRGHENQISKDLSIFRKELAETRISVLKLFYPNLIDEERVIIEPLLQTASPLAIDITQVEAGLKIINKLILYKKQSKAKENRGVLEKMLLQRKNAIRQTLDVYYQNLKLQN